MLPDLIVTKIESEIGLIESTQQVAGGNINQAAKIRVGEKDYFVKWYPSASSGQARLYPGMFQAEATGFNILERTKTVRVPNVIFACNECLVLEWMELATSHKLLATSLKKLGQQLAKLHANTAKLFGLASNNFIGTLPQSNTPTQSWIDFYWGQRIKPQMEMARRRQRLTPELEDLLERLYDNLPNLIPDKPEASLLHGDLWGGNWSILENGNPIVFDPAVYCGHREMDIAMTELFGGFGKGFYEAYNAEWKLDAGYKERKQLYQLYPLMVHMNLFGGGYSNQVSAVIKQYL